MLIGLTGRNCSGKGEAVRYLSSKGFLPLSLSDEIRREIRRRGLEVTREALCRVGNDLRSEFGQGVLASRVLVQAASGKHYVIDSIRHPEEVAQLRKRPDFFLFEIEASPEIRFERIKERQRESDPSTWEEFLRIEQLEIRNQDPRRQQLDATAREADFRLSNNGSVDAFHQQLDGLLTKLQSARLQASK